MMASSINADEVDDSDADAYFEVEFAPRDVEQPPDAFCLRQAARAPALRSLRKDAGQRSTLVAEDEAWQFRLADVGATGRQHDGPVTGLAVLGQRLISAGTDGRILGFARWPDGPLHNVGPELRPAAAVVDIRAIQGGEAGKLLLAAACNDCEVRIWDVTRARPGEDRTGGSFEEHRLGGHTAPVWGLDARHPFLLSASEDATARVWDMQIMRELVAMAHPHAVTRSLFFPGSVLLVTGCADSAVRVWDLRASVVRPAFILKASAGGALAVNERGQLACEADECVQVYDVPRCGARCVSELPLCSSARSLQFTSDGRHVACGCEDGDLYVAGVEGHTLQAFEVQQAPKRPLAYLQKHCQQSRCALLFAFEDRGWGYGFLEVAPIDRDTQAR